MNSRPRRGKSGQPWLPEMPDASPAEKGRAGQARLARCACRGRGARHQTAPRKAKDHPRHGGQSRGTPVRPRRDARRMDPADPLLQGSERPGQGARRVRPRAKGVFRQNRRRRRRLADLVRELGLGGRQNEPRQGLRRRRARPARQPNPRNGSSTNRTAGDEQH